MENLDGALETRRAGRSLDVAGRRVRPAPGKRGARFVVIALAAYLLWSGPHLIFHAAFTSTPIRRSLSPMVLAPVLLILAALRAEEMT